MLKLVICKMSLTSGTNFIEAKRDEYDSFLESDYKL